MGELKHFWDNLSFSEADESSIEYSLDKVLARIHRKRTAAGLAAAATVCLVVALSLLFMPRRDSAPEIQRYYTACGEKHTVTLPDGSTVQMNSASSIVYPERFTSANRTVVFSGEGIFNVTPDARHPFVVKAPSFEVEVLGTVFDIEAYPENDKATVVLSEGAVLVRHNGSASSLQPGQKAELLRDGSVSIGSASPADYMAWSKGGFLLQGADIDEIINLIRRTYGMEVQCSYSSKFDGTLITARSEHSRPVEEFLDLLAELIPGMKYTISDNTIRIY